MRMMLTVAAVLVAMPSAAEEVTDFDRFRLWNECRPIYLAAGSFQMDRETLGLNNEEFTALARMRFEASDAAHLLRPDDEERDWQAPAVEFWGLQGEDKPLYVTATFYKPVMDIASGVTVRRETWKNWGDRYNGEKHPVEKLVDQVDTFIDEYLRVNAEACGGPGGTESD